MRSHGGRHVWHFKPSWARNPATNCQLEFDFLISSHGLFEKPVRPYILEVDGAGHFKPMLGRGNFEAQRQRDLWKMKQAMMPDVGNTPMVRITALTMRSLKHDSAPFFRFLRAASELIHSFATPVLVLERHVLFERFVRECLTHDPEYTGRVHFIAVL